LDINDPTKLSTKAVKVDSQSRLQCTSCHDPHNDQYGNFLVVANTDGSALCLVCHKQDSWGHSAHAISTAVTPAAITSRLAGGSSRQVAARAKPVTIAANGCANCHANHQAGSKSRLMLADAPEQNCLVCHSGTTAKKNIAADFQKMSIHPITLNSWAHSPAEDPINPKTRHVVCADCHNSHATSAQKGVVPMASGVLAGLAGVSAGGGVIKPLLKEYELCFRCHADSLARGPATVSRQFPQTNTRLQFASGNQSFHPVETIGKNLTSVPSLISPWTVNSQMYCTDCHNSDSSPKAGGMGANGPHGSIYRPILERNLALTDGQPENAPAYALCYKCHSRSIILNESFHKHVEDVKVQAACTTCHDSHGVANAPHLINFNTTYVTPGSAGTIKYISTGTYRGICTLKCHGVDHNNRTY